MNSVRKWAVSESITMSRIGKSEISQGEILSVDELIARIDAVTAQEAQAAAARVFGQPMALAVVGPFRSNAYQDARRGGAPAEAPAMAAHTPAGPR